MGNLRMNADQISYKGGEKPMSVEEAIKNAGNTGLAHTADIAPEFSTESAYNTGDLVYHNGTLYVFTANHAAGAWSTEDTQAVTVGGELTSLMSGLIAQETVLQDVLYTMVRKNVLVVTVTIPYTKPSQNLTANASVSLGTLPQEYRPTSSKYLSSSIVGATGQSIGCARITINTNGDISIMPGTAIDTNTDVFMSCVYII